MESGGDQDESCGYETGKRESRKTEVVEVDSVPQRFQSSSRLPHLRQTLFSRQQYLLNGTSSTI
ncbi:hypothetical protein IRJ41_001851 [Triplophysa rosa]|uniref:Uncharacterized protein n=1 Tax=Triplophysa rosa TaxID=992332 RepID=A0A9W7TBV3_TRIRA|nr:hypothetical protein IRJ41_001851 [Triplophysa rosa]